MPNTVEDVTTLARSILDDTDGAVYTDAILTPFLASAYRNLQRRLAENGVSVMTNSADILVPQGQTQISDAGTPVPALPSDFIAPHKLEEAGANTTETFCDMQEWPGELPDRTPGASLRIWEWRDDMINLVGATRDITVRLRYERKLTDLANADDILMIRDSIDALAFSTVALAARSRGVEGLAQTMDGAGNEAIRQLLNRYVKARQHRMIRRKPYSYRQRAAII